MQENNVTRHFIKIYTCQMEFHSYFTCITWSRSRQLLVRASTSCNSIKWKTTIPYSPQKTTSPQKRQVGVSSQYKIYDTALHVGNHGWIIMLSSETAWNYIHVQFLNKYDSLLLCNTLLSAKCVQNFLQM